jgi:hypothetical protein
MNKYLHLIFLFAVVSCVGTKVEQNVTNGNINALAPYLWNDKSFPKTIQISNDFTPAEVTSIQAMSTAWHDQVGNKNFFGYGLRAAEVSNNINNMDTFYDNVMGIYKTVSWPDGLPTSALAVTQIFGRRYNTGSSSEFVNIEHADILVNYEIFNFDTADTGAGYDLRTVILHEMGHFLGLQHNTSVPRAQSVMYPSISSTEAKRTPLQADINDMANKYSIAMGGGGGSAIAAMSAGSNGYVVDESKPNEAIKILIELHADGQCVHKVNGAPVGRHYVELKK